MSVFRKEETGETTSTLLQKNGCFIEFDGNSAWLEIGRLAWNLGKWIAQLTLPPEVVRWEWKRNRKAFVHVAAEVVHRSRQRWLRFSPAHHFLPTLVAAHAQIRT